MPMKLLMAAILIFGSGVLSEQIAQVKAPQPAPGVEVNLLVDAMNGVWTGKMTANVPGAPAESFDWKMNCQMVAQGAGLSCTNTGEASIGSMSESCLLAFDPEGKAIHYMCVTSMGEVHDHKGKWVDRKTIEFEPLRAGMMNQPITETLRWHFEDSDTIDKTSEVKLSDGSTMKFEFTGKRVGGLVPAK
ncbi:MAG TPA: DUF1579 family protein [Pyrinomonadaceae bacterium]|nr:DUF1579 family protein [Pyrinomonadaceae bacterium]